MSKEFSDLHETARQYALAGIPVFPCREGGKTPATPRGFQDATTDLDQIDAWWTENPQYNIAIEPERVGWCVIDPDGSVGEQSWASLVAQHGAPPHTFEVSTPRGGRHIYFKGSLPGTVGTPTAGLANKVDTRGRGSYVLVPPSHLRVANAFYHVTHDCEVALLPSWISEALGRRHEVAKAAVVERDTPGSLDRVGALLRGYVEAGDVAVEGHGGDDRTYKLCAEVLNLGVSEPTAVSLIFDHWNSHCEPPWTLDELETKVQNAGRFMQNEAAAWAVPTAQEAFGSVLDQLPPAPPAVGRSRYYPFDEDEQDDMQEPTWLIPDLLPDRATVMFYGVDGSYKSFLALELALTIASGLDKHGYTAGKQRVVYAAAEGPRSISRARRPAWRVANSVEGPMDFSLITDVPLVVKPETVDEFCQAIEARKLEPRLVVIDTLARAMAGMEENNARDAGSFIEAIEAIKRRFACTVLVVHHAGKEGEKGPRGNSALRAGFDAVYEVKAHKMSKAVAIYCRKQKDADERVAPWTFEGKVVGTSLVFFETNAMTHRALMATEDVFEPRKVGAALTELKSFGVDHGVTTSVLAAQLAPPRAGENQDERQKIIENYTRQLRALAKDKLQPYTERRARELLWFLPLTVKMDAVDTESY